MASTFSLRNTETNNRAAVISPVAGAMDVSSTATVGVAQKQQVLFTNIKSIFEKELSLADSIKLLSCFSVEDKNGPIADSNDETTQVSPMLDVNLLSTKEADFKAILQDLFDNATQLAGNGPAETNGRPVEDLLRDGMRTTINKLLASNDLLDMLEANNVMSVNVFIDKTGGALDMFKAISGTRSNLTASQVADIKAKRRLFLTQIPKATLESYLKMDTNFISFLPLKGGDSMTFVFDIKVTPPNTVTAVVKDATADNHTGANAQTGNDGITSNGSYVNGSTVSLVGPSEIHRVAFVAHLGNVVAPFPQDFTTEQYDAIEVPVGQDKTQANYAIAFNNVAGSKLIDVAPVLNPTLQTTLNAASEQLHVSKLKSINDAKVVATTAYTTTMGTNSVQSALIAKVQAKAVLDAGIEYRTSLSSELTTAIGVAAAADLAYTTQFNLNTAWTTSSSGAGGAWGLAQQAALVDLRAAYGQVETLSQELPALALALAEARDEFYPNSAVGPDPPKLATLSSELASAIAATISAENAYQLATPGSSVAAFQAWQQKRDAEVTAREKYTRKVNMIATKDSYYLPRYTAAQAALTAAVTLRDSKKTAYIDEYQTSWSIVGTTPTKGSATNPFIAPLPGNEGTPVTYDNSRMKFVGYASPPSDADKVREDLNKTRLQNLYNDQAAAVVGFQNSYDGLNSTYNTLADAEAAYMGAVTATSSAFNVDINNLNSLNLLQHLGANPITTATAILVATAQAAYDTAKKNAAKALAYIAHVGAKVSNYMSTAVISTRISPVRP
jgi:hypothetical protein